MKTGDVVAGRFELEEPLGLGGMSRVFRARDRVLDRDVALKILHERFSHDPDYVERFRREARAIARLSHPNIVAVMDRGEVDGRQYIVFELVAGKNLKALLEERRRPLSVAEALALVREIGRGLAFAHAHGIVHRDVKPQNVLVPEDGPAKVTDFGIARALAAPAEPAARELTQTGTILGTSDYIAPEQAMGVRADERSDQYSLAVLLYELLTGRLPYRGETSVVVAMRHVHDPVPSVRERRRDVPPELDAVIRRAMSKRPEDRFPSIDAFVAALEESSAGKGAAHERSDRLTEVLPPAGADARGRGRRGRGRLRLGGRGARLLAAAIIVGSGAALLGAVVTGQIDVDGQGSGDPVRLAAVRDHDPYAGDGEHPELVGAATDGKRSTYWQTETYGSFEKPGVGVVLDARSRREVEEVTLVTETPGFRAVVRAGDSPSGPFDRASDEQTVARRTTFALDTPARRYYLLWITELDRVARVNEVRARS